MNAVIIIDITCSSIFVFSLPKETFIYEAEFHCFTALIKWIIIRSYYIW